MLDIKFIRENPDAVKENIRKKFQNAKLPLVDEVIALDAEKRAAENEGNDLRAQRNKLSKQVGMLMGQAKKDPSKLEEAEAVKAQVKADADRLAQLEEMEEKLSQQIHHILLVIPQMIDPSVPIGKDDSCNVEVQRFGEAVVPDFPIPYHTEIIERFDGIDLDAARRVSGNGFYYLAFLDAAVLCDIAHKAVTLTCILYIVVKYTGNLAVKGHYTYVYLIGEYGRYLCVIWRYLAHHTYKSV